MFQQKEVFTYVRESNVSGGMGTEPGSARVQGEVGDTVELGERQKEEEWWRGSHCNRASREGLVRWIKQSGFELGR